MIPATPTSLIALLSFFFFKLRYLCYRGKCVLLAFCLFLYIPCPSYAVGKTFVLYPELSGAYQNIFQSIIDGIRESGTSDVELYPLSEDYQLEKAKQTLYDSGSDGIISLGKKGHRVAKHLNTDLPLVAGALSLIPNGISGVSLTADPHVMFAKLKMLHPESKRVFVVYSERLNGWLIPSAKDAAEQNGLQLVTYPAADLREAMHHYRNLLEKSESGTDAIWLPLDRVTVNDDVILPLLLQSAWDKNLLLMSNKPGHAKRGVLFAMYPDNYGLGQQLAELLEQQKIHPERSIVLPLSQLNLAINLRTASHLGLTFNRNQRDQFTLTFPSQ
ncbi:putative ABC transport system substrate-binding protein [Malonomonas rubra DSM 5091]|uniref:Putative ABC transport system substrate-binding protein n=1 Tax=Malonomonas rubra DSM 5091 TaxID=1122189 RepID=A0A1M6BHX5_MALRU|nr:ABC transporter substrate binding protein [Malonomonas rubra]SHI48083.1 putative ABC transport system substrate-binding protein [Malonomonas rubra DSM 5091]